MSKTLIFSTIEQFCNRENLFSPGQTIIIGLSGGPDSVALLYFFNTIKTHYNLTLVAAHMDHGWREESPQDAEFCKQLCADLNITYTQKKLSEITYVKTGSLEQDARNARRTFFETVAAEHKAHAIALAHHQDDLIETFFIRLIRGAGLTGLTSIKPHQDDYIRPLLETTKTEISNYLHENNIPYCTDKTNQDISFLRNNIRKNLIPVYNQLDTRAHANLVRTIEQLQKTENFIETQAQEQYTRIVHDNWLDIEQFLLLDQVLQHRILLLLIINADVQFTPTEKFFAEITRFFEQPESKTHWVHADWGIEKKCAKAHQIVRIIKKGSNR